MKKLIVFIFLSAILLSSCKSQIPGVEHTPTDTYVTSKNFASEFEKCKAKDYDNLDLSECSAMLPEFSECYRLDLTNSPQKNVENKDIYNSLTEYCKFFFDDFDDENILFSSSSGGIAEEPNGKYAWYPKANDYKERLFDGSIDIDSFFYRDIIKNRYLWWHSGAYFPHWINKGVTFNLIKNDDLRVSAWIPFGYEQ